MSLLDLLNGIREVMENLVLQVPIVQQAIYFLKVAGNNGGIKLTEKGALGRNFVQSFWDIHIKTPEFIRFRPTREFECPEITKLHFYLSESKYVRKFKGKICLTEKGKSVLKNKLFDELYRDLLTVGTYRWNWGYEDRYPEFEFIQQSAEELINSLLVWPSNKVSAEQIYDKVLGSHISAEKETREQLNHCLNVRFFHRFCVPFGILKDDGDRFLDKRYNHAFEKTDFFTSSFLKVIGGFGNKRNNLDTAGFTPEAQGFWDGISPQMRVKLMNNAFCFACKAETGIGNATGSIEEGDLILKGICTKCGEPVVRLIERE